MDRGGDARRGDACAGRRLRARPGAIRREGDGGAHLRCDRDQQLEPPERPIPDAGRHVSTGRQGQPGAGNCPGLSRHDSGARRSRAAGRGGRARVKYAAWDPGLGTRGSGQGTPRLDAGGAPFSSPGRAGPETSLAVRAPMKAIAIVAPLLLLVAEPSPGQCLKVPAPGIRRTSDGGAALNAPAPRGPDGRPVIAGLWRPTGGLIGDISRGLKAGETVPFQPWAEAMLKTRIANNAKDDPTSNCLVGGVPRSDFVPYPFKILEMPGLVTILYEAVHSYRQIFTDGRALPREPNPAWFGYSVGKWEGGAFVVESTGFNDNVWLDNAGRPATEQLRVTERFIRRDFGHMDIEITINDPKAYTRPWTVTERLIFLPDTDIIEYMCTENNRYFRLVPDAAPPGAPLPKSGR